MYPTDIKYTKDHEWVRDEGDECVVGITAYATEQLGDVTYVELPDVNNEVDQGDAIATVESVKAANDIYAPVSGRVSEVNEDLEERPDLVNSEPYGDGWFFKLTDVKRSEVKGLMDVAAYEAFVKESTE